MEELNVYGHNSSVYSMTPHNNKIMCFCRKFLISLQMSTPNTQSLPWNDSPRGWGNKADPHGSPAAAESSSDPAPWGVTQDTGSGKRVYFHNPGKDRSLNRGLQHRLFSREAEHFSTCHDTCQAQNTGEGWGPWGLFSTAAPWETHPPPPPCMWEARLCAGRGAWPQAALSAQAGLVWVQRSPEQGSGWKQPPSRRGEASPKRLHKCIS